MQTIKEKGKESKVPGKRGGPRPGSGRPKGSLDKGGKLIREMVVLALDEAGGTAYLAETARTHQAAFLSLIGKVLPIQVTGEDGGPMKHSIRVTFG